MNEFEGKPKEFLNAFKINIESYLQGVTDTLNIIDDIRKKTLETYNQKLYLINLELQKHNTNQG